MSESYGAEPLSDETRDILRKVGVATICTQLFKRGFRNTYLQQVSRANQKGSANLVGPAFTVRNIPAREDLDHLASFANPEHPLRKGVESIPPGHVLVIDCRGETRVPNGGDILLTRLKIRGAAGLVSDGPVRDSVQVAKMEFPVFCAGTSAALSLAHHHAADLNVPIGCGGVPVYPGDVVVGDDDGVVIIPHHLADEVALDALEQEQLEAFILARIEGGAPMVGTYPPSAEVRLAYEASRTKGLKAN